MKQQQPYSLVPGRGRPRKDTHTKNALLIDKASLQPGMRKLSLKGGTTRPGRMYWYAEYKATGKKAKERAYQEARDYAAVMRLQIVDERVE